MLISDGEERASINLIIQIQTFQFHSEYSVAICLLLPKDQIQSGSSRLRRNSDYEIEGMKFEMQIDHEHNTYSA